MKKLDGNQLSKKLKSELKQQVQWLNQAYCITPCLAVLLVGDNPASQVYVKHKVKACKEVGIQSKLLSLSASISMDEMKKQIQWCNQQPNIHAILVQLPLPSSWNESEVISWIHPDKDADGLTIHHVGSLWGNQKGVLPCTPHGVIRLLQHKQISLEGRHAVVIGRSQIVGLPMSKLLLNQGATVTICHSKTKNLKTHTLLADVVVVACGKHHYLDASYFKEGSVVVDVGIHRIHQDGRTVLQGDVYPKGLDGVLSYVSPVPGGVGPMTIAMLLENTIFLAKKMVMKDD